MRAIHTDRSLSHFGERPSGSRVSTLVIHAMYDFAGDSTNAGDCIRVLDENTVSAHFLISRRGKVIQLIPESKRAWHAGESRMPDSMGAAHGVNDFSIGIELIARDHETFTGSQYRALGELTSGLCSRHPIQFLVGHEDIAIPKGRKSDPGERFDWYRYRQSLAEAGTDVSRLTFRDDTSR